MCATGAEHFRENFHFSENLFENFAKMIMKMVEISRKINYFRMSCENFAKEIFENLETLPTNKQTGTYIKLLPVPPCPDSCRPDRRNRFSTQCCKRFQLDNLLNKYIYDTYFSFFNENIIFILPQEFS